jgi:putative SOS response-associated peptidase YedK
MCYGSKPVANAKGGIDWIPNDEFNRLYQDGVIVTRRDGYHYAKDALAAFVRRGSKVAVIPMRWDLIPRHFLGKEETSLLEAIKRKNSRAKGAGGFDSYNARVETVADLYSFRQPWKEGLRMATPVTGFKERPNMEGAPKEFTGREYEVLLDGGHWLAGLWDRWDNGKGESLDSCAILTMDSAGNDRIRGIWHERTPIVLTESQIGEWLDPETTPERALAMCRLFPPERMEIKEVVKEKPAQTDLFG